MRILAVISGEYGLRHVDNIRRHGPATWQIEVWQAPAVLPPVIDYPEDYLPESLPPADLIMAFGEHRGVAELIPDVARMTGARAVIAPVDREEWLPRGLARQLRGWLAEMGVACVTPKPFCSLAETHYNVRRHRVGADDQRRRGGAGRLLRLRPPRGPRADRGFGGRRGAGGRVASSSLPLPGQYGRGPGLQ